MAAVHILILLIVALGCLVIVVTRNIVHAAYALALTLTGVAGMYVLLNAELLAVTQILIYAGGVVILLAFGIMLTNRVSSQKVITESKNKGIGGLIAITTFVGTSMLFYHAEFDVRAASSSGDPIEQIGISFLTDHIVAFELIALILLVALVGAAYLAKMSADE